MNNNQGDIAARCMKGLKELIEEEQRVRDRYRRHNLRECPNDLPQNGERVLFYTIDFKEAEEQGYYTGNFIDIYGEKLFRNDDVEAYATRGRYYIEDVIAWQYIEPLREECE